MTNLKIAGIAVQGERFGIGHASRSRYLLGSSKELGWKTSQFDITEIIDDQKQVENIISELRVFDCIIIDVDPRFAKENCDILNQVFVALQQSKCTRSNRLQN